MYVLKKKLRSAAVSHRLRNGYPGKCKNFHGHNYFFEIEVGGRKLNEYGMLIDFGDIKTICDKWIQDNWDHSSIVDYTDIDFQNFLNKEESHYWVSEWEGNTTAERMSEFLANLFFPKLKEVNDSILYVTVRVWETEDSVAEFTVGTNTLSTQVLFEMN